MSIVVLGARGFLGRNVVRGLRAAGLEVVESERPDVVAAAGDAAILALDLAAASPTAIAGSLRGAAVDVVVNCSGLTAGSPEELERATVLAVERLLDALALASGARRIRLVHIGSAAEYGRGPTGVPVREDAPAEPLSQYGATKLAATNLVAEAARRRTIDGVVLRVFNAVGPRMPPTSLPGAVVRRIVAARSEEAATIEMGPLGSVRDFVDVRDIASAVVAAVVVRALPDPIVNVGSGTGHTARELVEGLARRLGYQGRIDETASAASSRSADVPWQVADISLARGVLHWTPAHDLDSIVEALAADANAAT